MDAPDALVPAPDPFEQAFAAFLRLDVANGDAAPDTLRGYRAEAAAWGAWCRARGVAPQAADAEALKAYRRALVEQGYRPAAIAFKLAVVRRVYQAAVAAGLRPDNPAVGVRAPRARRAAEDFGCLSEVYLALVLRAVPGTGRVKDRRDRVLLGLLALQGLRTIEVVRAGVADLQRRDAGVALLVRGKGHDRLVYLRPDVAAALDAYLAARGPVAADAEGVPLLAAVGNRAGGRRISRRGVRQVVDDYLARAGVKRPGVSGHALRHTAATLAYAHTRDLRAVQDLLGHADPRTTSRYARVVNLARTNPALAIPVALGGDEPAAP